MNWLWRLVDSRNHIEGKIVAVITAFVLAFTLFGSYGPVSAFAGGGSQDNLDVSDVPAQVDETAESSETDTNTNPDAATTATPTATETTDNNAATQTTPSNNSDTKAATGTTQQQEETYPAFNGSAKAGDVTVTVTADAGVVPAGASVTAKKVESSAVVSAVEEKVEAEGKQLVDAVAIDVTLLDKNGNEIQPKGKVNVKFSNTNLEGEGTDYATYYVSDDASTVEEVTTTKATETEQTFVAEHFSIYTLALTDAYTPSTTATASTSYSIKVGDTVNITATSNQGPNSQWTSSNTSVATVSGSGKTGTVTGVSAGTATIKYGNQSFTVEVTAAATTPVQSVTINEGNASIYVGANLGTKFTATVDPSDAQVTWSSSDTSIATVSSDGVVTGLKEGTVTITATAGDKTDTRTVTVNSADGITFAYVYLNSTNLADYGFPNLSVNDTKAWYTVGYIALDSDTLAALKTTNNQAVTDELKAQLKDIVRFTSNTSIPTQFIIDMAQTYNLFESSSGANDYVTDSSQSAYHLDLYMKSSSATHSVTINYLDLSSGKQIAEPTIASGFSYEQTVDSSYYSSAKIRGYTYVSADPASITVSGNPENDVINLYYKQNGSLYVYVKGLTTIYDGQAHEASVSVSNSSIKAEDLGLELSYKDASGNKVKTPTDAGTYSVTANLSKLNDGTVKSNNTTYDVQIVYQNENGTPTTNSAPVTIKPRQVTITANSDEILTYTGQEQTVSGVTATSAKYSEENNSLTSEEGLLSGHTTNATASRTETYVGEYLTSVVKPDDAQSIQIFNGSNDVTNNYAITTQDGTMKISAITTPITITASSADKVYDGTALSAGATYTDNVLVDGDVLVIETEGEITDITSENIQSDKTGQVANTVKSYKVVRNKGAENETDVTKAYNFKSSVNGTLTIKPAPLTITVADASKIYGDTENLENLASFDGLQNNEEPSSVLGDIAYIRTNADEAAGTYEGVLEATINGSTLSQDAENPTQVGNYNVVLEPGNFTIIPAGTNVVTATAETKTYDGAPISITAAAVEDGSTLQYSTDGTTFTTENPSFTNAGSYTVYVKATNPNFDETPVVQTSVVVNPATLTVTTPSATKTFDGTALASVGTLTGLVNGETATFTTTGNQTEVGTSANTYEIAWDGTALQGNYTVVENLGTLTVNAAPVVPAPAATPVTPAAVVAAIPAVVGAAVAAAPAAVAAAGAAVAAAVGAGAPAAPADETTIDDDANPLANYEADAECWVHWLMIIGMIISAIYGAAVVGRRARYTNKIESIEDSIL